MYGLNCHQNNMHKKILKLHIKGHLAHTFDGVIMKLYFCMVKESQRKKAHFLLIIVVYYGKYM